MTGFASGQGEALGLSWTWDLRSVNNRGLDIRIRVPDWIEGLEQALRAMLSKRVARGSITVSLRLQSNTSEPTQELNEGQLDRVLSAMLRIEEEAMARGLSLTASSAADLISVRGVMDVPHQQADPGEVRTVLTRDFEPVLDSFLASRKAEGAALAEVLTGQIAQVSQLVAQATEVAEARKDEQAERMRTAMARVLDAQDGIDEQRIAQELALIAVKVDVTEELDRLTAHVAAATDLLGTKGAVGRKLDFLMQEFNREANTLCSKAQSSLLTAVGLELKSVIEQMREQVQNVE
ncbi:YicC family protein [Marivita sp. S6314]|uniref:YicC/YloC family endoribonuclease n=1 Tax=Marivita sp. S6314 TaxID=2926406 RepID=UPI001FF5EC8A|nr:YicC/YloC family endoribonuclease [Marivita sp. S6314]MCK0148529.1 YicC family protein [Marivita sp. S6314]